MTTKHHPATAALRGRSPALLMDALAGTLTEGLSEWRKDRRDLMVALAPFHDCAARLGVDPADIFRQAAEQGPDELRETVVEFGRRTDVTPTAFAFALDDGPDGPSYRSTLWPHEEPPEELFRRTGLLDDD